MAIIGSTASGFFYPQRALVNYGQGRNVYVQLWSIPQANIPAHGITIFVTDGLAWFTLTDCAVDKGSMLIGEDGHILQVGLFGPTWRWNGEISGVYNVRNPDGTVVTELKKNCRQLAILLWQSMGVTVGDVSALPGDDSYLPEVNWQCSDAFAELALLCGSAGCEPQLNAYNNTGEVVRLGVGPGLPSNGDVQTVDNSFNTTPPPQYLKACAGPTLYQSKLKMKMMMLEPDGTLVEADDVSYKPSGGWDGVDPNDPLGPDADPEDRAAARKSYGKYWMVDTQADGTKDVPGYGAVPSMERILPLLDEVAEDFDSGIGMYQRRAYLKGTIAITGANQSLENSPDDELIEVEFRLIRELGLFITTVPLIKFNATQQYVKADVYLVCSYHVQNETRYQYEHYTVERLIAPAGGGTKAIRLPNVVRRVIAEYDGTSVSGTTNNETAVNAALNGALDSAQTQYQVVLGSVRRYRGVQAAPLSGTIRQIRILIDMEDGAFTWLSHNSECTRGMPGHRQRQRNARDARGESLRELQDHERRRLQRRGRA